MKIVQRLNSVSIDRALIYTAVAILIYSLQFLYLCLQVIIRMLKLADQGSPLFLIFAFGDFILFIIFLSTIL